MRQVGTHAESDAGVTLVCRNTLSWSRLSYAADPWARKNMASSPGPGGKSSNLDVIETGVSDDSKNTVPGVGVHTCYLSTPGS